MEEQLVVLVIGDAGAASIIGDRFFPGIADQGALRPYAVYRRIGSDIDYTASGASGYAESRVQIDCYGETYASAKLAMRMIRRALSGRRGGIFKGIFAGIERDLSEQDSTLTQAERLYRVSQDFMVHHTGD